MGDTERKLDALIDALGFDVEETKITRGMPYGSLAGSPAGVDVTKGVDGLWFEYDTSYKLTKSDPEQTHNELIIELAKGLYKHSVASGAGMHQLNYNDTTPRYNTESGLMEIFTDEN